MRSTTAASQSRARLAEHPLPSPSAARGSIIGLHATMCQDFRAAEHAANVHDIREAEENKVRHCSRADRYEQSTSGPTSLASSRFLAEADRVQTQLQRRSESTASIGNRPKSLSGQREGQLSSILFDGS